MKRLCTLVLTTVCLLPALADRGAAQIDTNPCNMPDYIELGIDTGIITRHPDGSLTFASRATILSLDAVLAWNYHEQYGPPPPDVVEAFVERERENGREWDPKTVMWWDIFSVWYVRDVIGAGHTTDPAFYGHLERATSLGFSFIWWALSYHGQTFPPC
jgi:hypothetical protein